MNLNSVVFACTSLTGVNKVGTLKQDENGYYPMVVGALNVFNSGGSFYPLAGAKQLFEESSSFQRRVQRGALRGEMGHPKPPPRAMTAAEQRVRDEEFIRRNLSIYEERVCCHHMKIWLDFDSVKDKEGRPVISIMSLVKPSGELGHVLEKQLQNPHENVCFSIRSFTDNRVRFGIEERTLKEIVTFDCVNEPGIATAEKYFSPALESHFDMPMSRGLLEDAIIQHRPAGMSNESMVISAESLFNAIGYPLPNQEAVRRPSLNWR